MSGAESWARVGEGVIAGIHHALNNRLATISAVGQVLESELPPGHPLAGALNNELVRFESTTALLRHLTSGGSAEPVQVENAIADAAQLFELHHGLREVELRIEEATGLPPVWIDPGALLRALLVMLASSAGGASEVRVSAAGGEEEVEVRVARGARGRANEGIAGVSVGDAEAMLRPWGGRVEGEGELLTAFLPTLAAARRREGG